MAPPSPWQHALGDRFGELHPRLQQYFGSIQMGRRGHGRGVFEVVGTPRRWLWPALAMLAPAHVLFPVWQRDVSFTIVNTPGDPLTADRTFEFARGKRTMRDAVAWTDGRLYDVLGEPQRVRVRLNARVVDGELRLTSDATWLIVAGVSVRIPAFVAPRMTLAESIAPDGRQRVDFALTAPLIGTVYEYRGSFDYRIEPA
jgi:hypothetical protein